MTTQTTPDTAQVARWFHALSDETRLGIVGMLAGGECCVCELTDALDAAQSRLSFHLKTLKTAGVVSDRKVGRWVYYSLNPEVLDAMADFVARAKPVEGASHGCGCG
ncbi:MAG TPA: metalloregulator ArsR/SmtB family transcription factor [Longimicrobium sp.]|jgi:ArsR family transcriptional regulator